VSFLAQFIQFIANNDALISHPHFQNFIQPHVRALPDVDCL
jgi:hypothetical protein